MTEIVKKAFYELGTNELFMILKSRMQVFIVEQHCPYQDIDDKDLESMHVYLKEGNDLKAYLRIFMKDEESVQMGRVLSIERNKGYGKKIVEAGIETVYERFDVSRICIEAQTYATSFYEEFGFVVCGEEYLEDGIAHIAMVKELY